MSTKGIKTVIAELKRIGLSDHAIAGVLGNLENEGSWDPAIVNSSGHTGLAQWDSDRFARLTSMAKKNGWGDPKGWQAQAKYLAWEIKSGKGGVTVQEMNATGNARKAAILFENKFERAGGDNLSGRIASARKFAGSKILKNTGTSVQGEAPAPKVPGSKNGKMTWVPKVGPNVGTPYGQPGGWDAGWHTGADIPGGAGGQPIRWAPPMGGRVVKSGTHGEYGNHMIIRDEKGREWLLGHMSSDPLEVGTRVNQGDRIGTVGATGTTRGGAHLHVEMTAPLDKGEHWDYGTNVKKPKIVFKVGPDGQTYDKDFKPTDVDFLDMVGMSGQALERPGNEELKKLVDQAIKEDWTTQEFTRRFKASKWYQDRAKSQRDFDMLQDTDQQQVIKQKRSEIRQTAIGMGVTLTKDEERQLAVRVARDGYTSQQIQWFIGKRYTGAGKPEARGGLALSTEDALKDKARAYGIRLDSSVLTKWTKEVLQKGTPVDSFDDDIAAYAVQQNSFLKDPLERGLTTREALQSYINTAAGMMGVTEDEIDLSDPIWREVFHPDGTPLSDYEWQTKMRSDPRYKYGNTSNAVAEARMHGRNLMRTMGVFSG